jgi:hypothetical protein
MSTQTKRPREDTTQAPPQPRKQQQPQQNAVAAGPLDEEAQRIQRTMGFTQFGSTKGRQVKGNMKGVQVQVEKPKYSVRQLVNKKKNAATSKPRAQPL